MPQTRHELEFAVEYSVRLESMTSSLMARCDRVSSFVQLVLGAAVFAAAAHPKLIGITLVVLAMFSFVWQPSGLAVHAKAQKSAYEWLRAQARQLSDEDLSARLAEIRANDSGEIGALCNAAHIGVEIASGLNPSLKLSFRECVIAWIAGDLPVTPSKS